MVFKGLFGRRKWSRLPSSGSQSLQSLLPSTLSSSSHHTSLQAGLPTTTFVQMRDNLLLLCVTGGSLGPCRERVFRENCSVFSKGRWWIANKTDSSANNAKGCSWEGFFIYFFCSIKKQMSDSCRGSLTTAIAVHVSGYQTWALWLKWGH